MWINCFICIAGVILGVLLVGVSPFALFALGFLDLSLKEQTPNWINWIKGKINEIKRR